MTESRGEAGVARRRGHGRSERKESFRIQNVKRIHEQAVAARISTPKIGLETAARMKEQMKVRRPKDNVFLLNPKKEWSGHQRRSVAARRGRRRSDAEKH